MSTTIQIKRGLAAAWTADNPILASAEIGVELGSSPAKFKIGDGATHWTSLPYAGGGSGVSLPIGISDVTSLQSSLDAKAAASALTSEVSRAEAAEGTLTTGLAAEVTRAEAAEAGAFQISNLLSEITDPADQVAAQANLGVDTSQFASTDDVIAVQAALDAYPTGVSSDEAKMLLTSGIDPDTTHLITTFDVTNVAGLDPSRQVRSERMAPPKRIGLAHRAMQIAFAKRATTPVIELLIADSLESGWPTSGSPTDSENKAWPAFYEQAVANAMNPLARSAGFLVVDQFGTFPFPTCVHWDTIQGTPNGLGAGGWGVTMTSGQHCEVTRTGDGVIVFTTAQKTGGDPAAAVTINGTPVGTIDTRDGTITGSTDSGRAHYFANPSGYGPMDVKVTHSGTGSLMLDAAYICAGNGTAYYRLDRAGHGGLGMTDFLGSAGASTFQHLKNNLPQIVTIQLGINDCHFYSVTPAQIAVLLTNVIALVRAQYGSNPLPSIRYIFEPYLETLAPSTWPTDYRAALRAVCEADGNVTFIDQYEALGAFSATDDAYLVKGDDNLHPNQFGHAVMALPVVDATLVSSGSGSSLGLKNEWIFTDGVDAHGKIRLFSEDLGATHFVGIEVFNNISDTFVTAGLYLQNGVPHLSLGSGTTDPDTFISRDGAGTISVNGSAAGGGIEAVGFGGTVTSRLVPGTVSGPPASGRLLDFAFDEVGIGWLCVSAGTPGTWVQFLNSTLTAAFLGPGWLSDANTWTVHVVPTTTGMTSVIAASTIGKAGLTYTNGDAVTVTGLSTTTDANGQLKNGGMYYIVNQTGSTVQIALEPGGTPIAFTGTADSATITLTGQNQFTIFGNATGYLSPGTRISYNDGAVDYGVVHRSNYVSATTTTTVTLIPNNDYAIANHALTAARYSHQDSPVSFPSAFNWTPVRTGFSAAPTNTAYRWHTNGRSITYQIFEFSNGTSNNATHTYSTPVPSTGSANAYVNPCVAVDSGTQQAGYLSVAALGSIITINGKIVGGNTATGSSGIPGGSVTAEF